MPAPSEGGGKRGWTLISGIVALLLVVGILAVVSSGNTSSVKDFLVNGPLGRSGFLAAFSLIFLSEIGDKTFFIAALLAMRLGRWISFVGSLGALAVMTVISVCIGAVFSRVPDAFKSSIPIGEVAGILLLVFFGLKALRDASRVGPSDKDDEQDEAERAVKEAERAREGGRISPLVSLVEVGTLIFLAEWGDRSMLATIALGAAQNPVGVAVGAIVGHAVATAIAVVGGAIAAKYVSEKTINIASGVLFLIFAAVTAWGMF